MADKMFTSHVQEHERLEPLLRERARPARENVESVSPARFADSTDAVILEALLDGWNRTMGEVAVGPADISPEPFTTNRRPLDPNDRDQYFCVWRWRVVFRVSGDSELLTRWPEAFAADPCGDDLQYLPLPWVSWQREGDSAVAYIDVPCDVDPNGENPPKEAILAASKYLRAAAEAVNTTVAAYEADLRVELQSKLEGRRAKLGVIEERRIEIIELERTRFGLEVEQALAAHDAPRIEADGVDLVDDLVLNFAVNHGTFENLLQVTKEWAKGAERYPETYGRLGEDPTTNLLVTTLNVAFDVAHREVFHAKGKTDIFVQANVNTPNEAAHVGEAKIWKGRARLLGTDGKVGDVDQVLGYATSRTTELMLVYYVRQISLPNVITNAHQAIQDHPAFVEWAGEGENREVILRHPTYGHPIRLAPVFAHFPLPGTTDPDTSADG